MEASPGGIQTYKLDHFVKAHKIEKMVKDRL